MSKFAFVTGSSRGIGFQFAKQLVEKHDFIVFASCRSPNNCPSLQQLKEANKDRLFIIPLDVSDEKSVQVSEEEMY